MLFLILLLPSCTDSDGKASPNPKSSEVTLPFFKGADLSYVNELEDVGVVFTEDGVVKDAYTIMSEYG